jgi:hypothetical protein
MVAAAGDDEPEGKGLRHCDPGHMLAWRIATGGSRESMTAAGPPP